MLFTSLSGPPSGKEALGTCLECRCDPCEHNATPSQTTKMTSTAEELDSDPRGLLSLSSQTFSLRLCPCLSSWGFK